jgi:hypothetical protein
MTLGPSSSCFFVTLTLLSGCAFGDVSGTGSGRSDFDRSADPSDSNPPTSAGGTTPAPASESGPTDYEALFDAPGDPTTTDDLVTGVWAGKTSYADVRLKLTANRIIVALKCDGAQATGLEFGAIVTSTQLKVLASKSVDGYYCGINVSPTVIRRCTTSSAYDCFDVSGTTLRFNDAELFTSYGSSANMSYTKLSD